MSSLIHVSEAATLGLHAMAYLARSPEGCVPARAIAKGLRVSEAHLVKVMGRLEKARLIQGARGPGGGYAFARPPSGITLRDVFEAIEGRFRTTRCLFGRSTRCGACILGDLFWEMDRLVSDRLAGTRLSDIRVGLQEMVKAR